MPTVLRDKRFVQYMRIVTNYFVKAKANKQAKKSRSQTDKQTNDPYSMCVQERINIRGSKNKQTSTKSRSQTDKQTNDPYSMCVQERITS